MCVGYCSLKIFEFTQTNSYSGEDNWVTPRLVTEKARNNPEGKFAFPLLRTSLLLGAIVMIGMKYEL